jgi:hypothetical protein
VESVVLPTPSRRAPSLPSPRSVDQLRSAMHLVFDLLVAVFNLCLLSGSFAFTF